MRFLRRVAGLAVVVSMLASALLVQAADKAAGPWEQPAAALAEQIAAILGPGQAHLTIRNLSNISTGEIPAIRRLIEQDLKARGVQASGAESANAIRVTLSANLRERLWVAEVVEGSEMHVTMVHVDPDAAQVSGIPQSIVLRKEMLPVFINPLPGILPDSRILAAVPDVNTGLVVLLPEKIGLFAFSETGYREEKSLPLGQKRGLPRDPRGIILRSSDEDGFTAYTAGTECTGRVAPADGQSKDPFDGWTLHCHDSDDPWPISTAESATGPTAIKAFYDPARNYFTGVVTPSLGVDLPPFYSAALLPRPDGAGLLIGGIDGKVQLVESSASKPVAGTRDWGSDFAALHSGCGAGTQIVASGSGEALTDSLRAYELPAQEAIPASAPLAMEGTVTALWTAPDGKSVLAVVLKPAGEGYADQYEVDRVTANCN